MFWILIAAMAGLCTGIFGLPMKFTNRWKWEHIWSLYAFLALFLAPWVIAFATVPHLIQLYQDTSWQTLGLVVLFGTLWGIASITFGLGLTYMGLAIGYSLMLGLIIVSGSLLPLITNPASSGLTQQVVVLIAGVAVMVVSLIINTIAAKRKENELAGQAQPVSRPVNSFGKGLLLCIITGIVACCLNYAFIYGDPIRARAVEMGVSNAFAANAILPMALLGAAALNMGYCFWMVNKGKTWHLYLAKGNKRYFIYALGMILWTIGFFLFGIASTNMGSYGNSIGWAVMNASAIIWANVVGVFSGEWKGVRPKTIGILIVGLIVMISGIAIVGLANSFTN
jgi:L-rhamnose-H+ transport protein